MESAEGSLAARLHGTRTEVGTVENQSGVSRGEQRNPESASKAGLLRSRQVC